MDVQVQLDFDSKGCFFFFLFTMMLCESCKPRGVQQFHLALMAANSWTGVYFFPSFFGLSKVYECTI